MNAVRLTDEAKKDLRDIGLYIAQDNPQRAISFVLELQQKCNEISKHPLLYQVREELPPIVRSVRHKKYLIFYSTSDNSNEVTVLRILHGSRNMPDIVKLNS